MSSKYLTREAFTNLLNEKFIIHFTAFCTMEAELLDVEVIRELPFQETFAVVFLAPPDAPFNQYLYELEHPKLGVFELFLVPVGKDDCGVRFEAIFNHIFQQNSSDGSVNRMRPTAFKVTRIRKNKGILA